MKKLLAVIFISTAAFASTAFCSENTKAKTFLGPTLKMSGTRFLDETKAYSLLGEAGARQFRLGGTLGFALSEEDRLKLSVEYLSQKLKFGFSSGTIDEWVQQAALGFLYQRDLSDNSFQPQFNFSGFASHAFSKNLDSDTRRIAGSDGGGISAGFSIQPWRSGRVTATVLYDHFRFDQTYSSSVVQKGLGASVELNQELSDRLSVNLAASTRKPFNNYSAKLLWNGDASSHWQVGLSGGYTSGKCAQQDSYDVGVHFNYSFDQQPSNSSGTASGDSKADKLRTFTSVPAVYMPQVMAMADEQSVSACLEGSPPLVVSSLPNITTPGSITYVNTAQAFSGENLSYSMSIATPSDGNQYLSIDPATGVVTVAAAINHRFPITVTASNGCGSASVSFEAYVND